MDTNVVVTNEPCGFKCMICITGNIANMIDVKTFTQSVL